MLPPNTLFYGDNLERLGKLYDETVDLIYLDPPFNSARSYNLLFKQHKGDVSPAQIMAFEDTWKWSNALYEDFKCDRKNEALIGLMDCLVRMLGHSEMMAYLLMMGPRLMEMHRVLKQTGSLYLHCDSTASGYLRLLLDCIFGPQRFQNEIIWKRTSSHNDATRRYGRVSDTIFYYTKSDKYTFNVQYTKYDEKYLEDFYRYVDEDGRRYRLGDLRSPNPRPNLTYDYKGYKPHPNGWAMTREKMEKLDAEGRLHFPKKPDGRIQLKRFLDEMTGVRLGNVWEDIAPVQSQAAERRGYPTQKPLALLERIIATSSNEGDVVLDPFCGCGTAVIQSARMKRRWIGIDITYLAIAEIMYRLDTETEAKLGEDYQIQGIPTDHTSAHAFFQATAKQNHKPFEMWAVSLSNAQPIDKKGGDRGIDGRLPMWDADKNLRWGLVQVKGGHLSVSQIRDFAHVVSREKAVLGMFISLEEPTRQMRLEAEEMGFIESFGAKRVPRLQLRTLKELLEEKKDFVIPSDYQPIRDQGVGRPQAVQTQMVL